MHDGTKGTINWEFEHQGGYIRLKITYLSQDKRDMQLYINDQPCGVVCEETTNSYWEKDDLKTIE